MRSCCQGVSVTLGTTDEFRNQASVFSCRWREAPSPVGSSRCFPWPPNTGRKPSARLSFGAQGLGGSGGKAESPGLAGLCAGAALGPLRPLSLGSRAPGLRARWFCSCAILRKGTSLRGQPDSPPVLTLSRPPPLPVKRQPVSLGAHWRAPQDQECVRLLAGRPLLRRERDLGGGQLHQMHLQGESRAIPGAGWVPAGPGCRDWAASGQRSRK